MNTNDLIKELSSKLTPVKKQDSPSKFALKYLLVIFLMIVGGILLLRWRSDLSKELANACFTLDCLINCALCLSGIFVVGLYSSAGRKYHRFLKIIMPLLFLTVLTFNAYRLSLTNFYFKKFVISVFDVKCFLIVMIFSILFTVIIGKAVSKRIVLNPGLIGAVIGLLSFSVGSFVIDVHCPITSEEHLTIYHNLLPMFSGTFIGYVLGKMTLRF